MINRAILTVIICLISIVQCSSLSQRNNRYYTEDEITILEKSLEAIDYGYGYDIEMDLNYVYAYSYSKSNFDKKVRGFSAVVQNADIEVLVSLYQKMVKVKAETEYKMKRYQEQYEYRYSTFIKRELYEPLEKYLSLLRSGLLKKNPQIGNTLAEKEYALKREVIESYVKDEEIIDTF